MTNEVDRFEREDRGGAFLMGLLAGTVLGAGLGMLFAPKAGAELRNQLSESANKLQRAGTDAYHQASDKVTHVVERGKDAYDKVVTTASQAASGFTGSAVPDRIREGFGAMREAVARGSEEMRGQSATIPGSTQAGLDEAANTPVAPGRRGSR